MGACSATVPAVARAAFQVVETASPSGSLNPTDSIQVSMSGAARGATSLIGSGGGRLVERVLDVEQDQELRL